MNKEKKNVTIDILNLFLHLLPEMTANFHRILCKTVLLRKMWSETDHWETKCWSIWIKDKI